MKELKFTEQELNVILFALQKQPFEMVNDLIQNIVRQLREIQLAEVKQKEADEKA
jgi:outer membrane lipopolysaccharide assembly protein LptE/RlpB